MASDAPSQQQQQHLPPGSVPGDPYIRVRILGQGSFGRVLLVRDSRTGASSGDHAGGQQSLYVMKEVDLMQFGAKGRKEAMKEVAFLNQLHHPFIIQYKEFFERTLPPTGGPTPHAQLVPLDKQGRPIEEAQGAAGAAGRRMLYIIMEYADGGDLDARIKRQKKLHGGALFPESQVLEWFAQIVLALKHIHDRRILHRDIKAENIFISSIPGGGGGTALKVGDFGISKHLSSTMAQAMTRIGTPYYLSPEICMNKPYNQKTDIWSLGVVLYELCTLRHPFDASSMEGLLKKIVKTAPAPLNARVYSPELRQLLDQMLQKDPRRRPGANELARRELLAPYIARALSREQIEDEFSHTIIHDYEAPVVADPSPDLPQQHLQPIQTNNNNNNSKRKKQIQQPIPQPTHSQQQQQQHPSQRQSHPHPSDLSPHPNPYHAANYHLPPAVARAAAYQPLHPGIKAVAATGAQKKKQPVALQPVLSPPSDVEHLPSPYSRPHPQQQQQRHPARHPPHALSGLGSEDESTDVSPAPMLPPALMRNVSQAQASSHRKQRTSHQQQQQQHAPLPSEREQYELARLQSVERQLAEERAHVFGYQQQQQQQQQHPGQSAYPVDADELRRFREYEHGVLMRQQQQHGGLEHSNSLASLDRERAKERELQKQLALVKARAPASFPRAAAAAGGGGGAEQPLLMHSPQRGDYATGVPQTDNSHARRRPSHRANARDGVAGSGPLPLVMPHAHHTSSSPSNRYPPQHQQQQSYRYNESVGSYGDEAGANGTYSSTRLAERTRREHEEAELAAIRESVAEEKMARRARRMAEESQTHNHVMPVEQGAGAVTSTHARRPSQQAQHMAANPHTSAYSLAPPLASPPYGATASSYDDDFEEARSVGGGGSANGDEYEEDFDSPSPPAPVAQHARAKQYQPPHYPPQTRGLPAVAKSAQQQPQYVVPPSSQLGQQSHSSALRHGGPGPQLQASRGGIPAKASRQGGGRGGSSGVSRARERRH